MKLLASALFSLSFFTFLHTEEPQEVIQPLCGIGEDQYVLAETLGGTRIDTHASENLPSQEDAMPTYWGDCKSTHPVPPGFSQAEYYNAEWQVSADYTFEFQGEFIDGDPVFVFVHNEAIAHAFYGFDLVDDVFSPLYEEYEQMTEDGWYRPNILSCRTGEQCFLLQPQREYRIRLPIPIDFLPKVRLKVIFSDNTEDTRIEEVPIVSDQLRVVLKAAGGMTFLSSPTDIQSLKAIESEDQPQSP